MRLLWLGILVFFSQVSSAQLLFNDVATANGVVYNYGSSTFGGGASFVDFNNDGWDDLTLTSDETQEVIFLRNDNGVFTRVTFPGIDLVSRSKQVIWVDYDNDGDKDFFVTSVLGQNKLYNNNGSFEFTDVTASSGLFTTDLSTYGATFGDMDNDGDLDLFITNREGTDARNYLYENNNGIFTDVTVARGIGTQIDLTFLASFFDYDNDGDQDIYIINDKTDSNELYQNDGTGHFTDVSITSGAGITIDAMSCTIGDYNADGWFDVYITNTSAGNYLMKNNGDGTFSNTATDAGVGFFSFAWGASFLDADLDGNLDLYVSSSMDGSVSSFLPSAFYHHNGDNTYTIPSHIGFETDTRRSFGNAIGDMNNDGKPDIVVMNENANYFLWENQSVTSNNWIKIKLDGVVSNKDGIGNTIEVHANGISQYRFTACGEGYMAQNSQYEFVGIGSAANIDYIKVTWNKTGIVETINNVQPNQSIRIQEGNGILSTANQELHPISIYPNPSDSGVFNVSSNTTKNYLAEVFDLSGRLILPKQPMQTTIDLSKYASGIYFVRVSTNGETKTFKLIVTM